MSNTLAVLAVPVVTALASCGDRAIKSPTDGGNVTGAGGVAGTGIAGAGGTSSVLVPPFEGETPTADCSAVARAFSPPLVVDVVLTCPAKVNFANVAIGTADQGFVAYGEYFRPPARLVTIAPSGGISESLGPRNSPALQVSTDVAGAPCAVSVGNEHASVGFYRLHDRGWWGEPVVPLAGTGVQETRPARFARDGRAFVTYYSFDDGIVLATRDVDGVWTRTPLPIRSVVFALATDRGDRPHVPYLTSGDRAEPGARVDDWFPGSPASLLWFPINDWRPGFEVAPAGADGVAVGMLFGDGVHVFVQQPGGMTADRLVPGTGALILTGCEKPATATPQVQSRACTETGEGVTGHALAAASNGLWAAYVRRHVDHDVLQSCWYDEGVTCTQEMVTDRSTSEVVVVRIPTDGAPASAPTVVWRAPIAETPDGQVAIDTRGSRLALVIMSGAAAAAPKTIRYLMLDTDAL